ncbi:hypothetical protein Tco_1358262, partial [Tanacetum coccineum]
MISNRDIVGLGFSFGDSVSNIIPNGAWRWPSDWLSRDVVMRPFSIRHAIHMWLVLKQKLKTQDKLRQWDVWSRVHGLCGMDYLSPRLMDVSDFIVPISKGKTIIVQVILSMVRLKLVTFKFKKMSVGSRLLLDQWKIPSYCIVHDGSTRGILFPPTFFTLVIEVLNLMVIRQVKAEKRFKYHWGSKELKITSLCFADDLLMLCHGDLISASVLRRGLDEFFIYSGLRPSMSKVRLSFEMSLM